MKLSLVGGVFFALVVAAIMASPAFAQDKVVFIDSYRIRLDFKDFQDAQQQFNKEVESWNVEVEEGQREIERLEAELNKQALILSEAKRKEKESEIEQKKLAWQKLANEIFGPDGRAEKRNVELTRPLLEKINSALERIALAEGYNLILDTVNGNIAYGKKELDITDRVLEELEKMN